MSSVYESPLSKRYASLEMQRIFSDDTKFMTWRKLWVALAESEQELGIHITDEQIRELKQNVDHIDYEMAKEKEKQVRHDVMAHILTYGAACPKAKSIIHLGATSAYVGDNTDIIQMKMGLIRIKQMLVNAIKALSDFAFRYKDQPSLAYTHFQAAQ
ncbi:MAG: adenylosuccinate lyase, partial [Oscillospiraceae bacterium]|nr:adenylosuccinate lyase [Oscillospiraceae bacterium]